MFWNFNEPSALLHFTVMWLCAFDATPIEAVIASVRLSPFSLQRLFTLLQLSMSSILTHGYVINRTKKLCLFIGHIKTCREKFGTLCMSHPSPVNLNPSAIWANESLTLSLSKPDFPCMFQGPRHLQTSILKSKWGTSIINGPMKRNFICFNACKNIHSNNLLYMHFLKCILKCWNSRIL